MADSESVSNLLDSLPLLVVSRYIDTAAGCLVIFDALLVLDLEVKYIWQSKLSVMKVMYIVNRYTTFIDFILLCFQQTTTRVTECPGLITSEGVLFVLGIYFAEYTFAMRTYVICGKRKIFWIPVTIFGVGSFLYYFISYFLTLKHVQYSILPPFNGCFADLLPSNGWINAVFLITYEAGMLILIGLVAFGRWRSDTRMRSDLFQVLYGEGVLFYIYILAFSIATEVTVGVSHPYLLIFMGRCVRSILASRVVLHIREVADLRNKTTISLLGNTNPG